MSCIEFEYSILAGIEVPFIPVGFKSNNKWYELWAFVDSGATYSVFEATDAEQIGIDIYKGKKTKVQVGDGSFIDIYLHKTLIKIDKKELMAEIGFSEQLGIGFNLLGRKDIFEIFKVCFSDRKKIISFSPM